MIVVFLAGAAAGCRTLPPDRIARSAGERGDGGPGGLRPAAAGPEAGARCRPAFGAASRAGAVGGPARPEPLGPGPGRSPASRGGAARPGTVRRRGTWRRPPPGFRIRSRGCGSCGRGWSRIPPSAWPSSRRACSGRRRKTRLLCERGRELLKAGRYAEAAQDLDEGLRGLDPAYRALYGADREQRLLPGPGGPGERNPRGSRPTRGAGRAAHRPRPGRAGLQRNAPAELAVLDPESRVRGGPPGAAVRGAAPRSRCRPRFTGSPQGGGLLPVGPHRPNRARPEAAHAVSPEVLLQPRSGQSGWRNPGSMRSWES